MVAAIQRTDGSPWSSEARGKNAFPKRLHCHQPKRRFEAAMGMTAINSDRCSKTGT